MPRPPPPLDVAAAFAFRDLASTSFTATVEASSGFRMSRDRDRHCPQYDETSTQ